VNRVKHDGATGTTVTRRSDVAPVAPSSSEEWGELATSFILITILSPPRRQFAARAPFPGNSFDSRAKAPHLLSRQFSFSEQGKPVVRPGRKAMGPPEADCQAAGAGGHSAHLRGSAMGLNASLRPVRRRRNRRGSAIVLTAIALVPLLGIVALAVDWGRICVAKAELQRTADSAAMAAVWELVESKSPGSLVSPVEAESESRQVAAEYAALHTALGKALELQNADVEVGYLANPAAAELQLATGDAKLFNAVRVRVRRDAGSNGSIPMFFARVLGTETADTEASATAVFVDNVAGFKAPSNGQNLPILPFALDAETWKSAVNGAGSDQWRWDPQTEEFVPGSDGIPEFDLYPQATGSSGNRGTVNIGTRANSTSHIAGQIEHGVSKADLDYHGGELRFNEDQRLYLDGDPGISAGFKDELSAIRGEGRIVPVFSEVAGRGGNGVYNISEWAGIRIAEVVLTGGDKRVVAQAAAVSTDGAIAASGDSGSTSSYVFSRVWICR